MNAETAARLPPVVPTRATGPVARTRRRRAWAVLFDAATLAVAVLAAAGLATAWLLARTGWGRDDVSSGEAALALGLIGAAVPAWSAWLALRLYDHGRTPGQQRAGLTIEASSQHLRTLRLAAHPLAVPLWSWLLAVAIVLDVRLLVALAGALVLTAGLGAIAAFALLLVRPLARAPHDILAHTRLVAGR